MFSPLVERALRAAQAAHAGQTRKSAHDVPYVTHPIHVALILARLGCDETVLAGALLHDVVEDNADWSPERIEREFSAEIRAIVDELTEDKTRTWQQRKQAGIESVRTMSPPAAAIKAADMLHNLRCLVDDLKAAPDPAVVWAEFKGGRERTIDHSRRLAAELVVRADPRLARALLTAVSDLEALSRD